jgi:hypothetical protein
MSSIVSHWYDWVVQQRFFFFTSVAFHPVLFAAQLDARSLTGPGPRTGACGRC